MTSDSHEELFREFQTVMRQMRTAKAPSFPHTHDLPGGLTSGEKHLLFSIVKQAKHGEKESVRPADLATQHHMSPQALSPMLKKLEQEGYISRRLSNTDRRVSYIEPTDEAKKLTVQMGKVFDEQMRGLITYLGEEDARKLISVLKKIGEYIEQQQKQEREEEGR